MAWEDEKAVIVCDDDRDTNLTIFAGGNGDYYATIHTKERPRLADAVRFRTSGSSQHPSIMMIMAILFSVGRGKEETALRQAEALCDILRHERATSSRTGGPGDGR